MSRLSVFILFLIMFTILTFVYSQNKMEFPVNFKQAEQSLFKVWEYEMDQVYEKALEWYNIDNIDIPKFIKHLQKLPVSDTLAKLENPLYQLMLKKCPATDIQKLIRYIKRLEVKESKLIEQKEGIIKVLSK